MASTILYLGEVVEIREGAGCDPECRTARCTAFCEARRGYQEALRATERATVLGDLGTLALALERLSGASRLVSYLHCLPIGSGLTERSTTT